jgi:hypothetical protein
VRHFSLAAILALFLTATVSRLVQGQVEASERGSVSQTVDGTVIEVSYGRPRLRGRVPFGGGSVGVVHWGEVWTPGANWATTLQVSKGVKLEGRDVAAGTYSVWFVPTQHKWTVYLHPQAHRHHTDRPRPADMLVGIPVSTFSAPSVELLTFSFPEVRRDGMTLQFQWGTTALVLRIDVTPTETTRARVRPDDVAAYVGEYTAWQYAENLDSTTWRPRLWFEDGRLKGAWGGNARVFELVPSGSAHTFWFESRDSIGPVNVELASPVIFSLDSSGRATRFAMRGIAQPFWLRGVRIR